MKKTSKIIGMFILALPLIFCASLSNNNTNVESERINYKDVKLSDTYNYDDHNHSEWWAFTNEWLDAFGSLDGTRNFCLPSNLTLRQDIKIADSAEIVFCLNGYTLTGTGTGSVFTLGSFANLTLIDCKYGGGRDGVIQNGNNSYGGGVYVGYFATFTMYDGIITNNTATMDGGGVYVYSGATFIMNGGTITDNTVDNSYSNEVYVYDYGSFDTTFTMNGGTITTIDNEYSVYCYSSNITFTMNGGYLKGLIIRTNYSRILIKGGYLADSGNLTRVDTSNNYTSIDLSEGSGYGDPDYDSSYPYGVYYNGGSALPSLSNYVRTYTCIDDISIFTLPLINDGAISCTTDFNESNTSYVDSDLITCYGIPTEVGKYEVGIYIASGTPLIDLDNRTLYTSSAEAIISFTLNIYHTGETYTKEENKVDATSTEEGSYDEVTYCSSCDKEISRTSNTIPATGGLTVQEIITISVVLTLVVLAIITTLILVLVPPKARRDSEKDNKKRLKNK